MAMLQEPFLRLETLQQLSLSRPLGQMYHKTLLQPVEALAVVLVPIMPEVLAVTPEAVRLTSWLFRHILEPSTLHKRE
jgi:hypothetical protein